MFLSFKFFSNTILNLSTCVIFIVVPRDITQSFSLILNGFTKPLITLKMSCVCTKQSCFIVRKNGKRPCYTMKCMLAVTVHFHFTDGFLTFEWRLLPTKAGNCCKSSRQARAGWALFKLCHNQLQWTIYLAFLSCQSLYRGIGFLDMDVVRTSNLRCFLANNSLCIYLVPNVFIPSMCPYSLRLAGMGV